MSKVSCKDILRKIDLLLWKKLYFMQPIWCTAKIGKSYVILDLALTKEMAQKLHFSAGTTKSNLKNLKI